MQLVKAVDSVIAPGCLLGEVWKCLAGRRPRGRSRTRRRDYISRLAKEGLGIPPFNVRHNLLVFLKFWFLCVCLCVINKNKALLSNLGHVEYANMNP